MADCELLHDGLLDEPVNALSSLAYVAAGAWVWRHDRRQGAALIAVGIGSFAYHGFGGRAAHALHDVTILLLLVLVAVSLPRIVRGAPRQPGLAALGAVCLGVALCLQLFGRTGGPWCAPDSVLQAHAGWHILTAVALGCGFVIAARAREHVTRG